MFLLGFYAGRNDQLMSTQKVAMEVKKREEVKSGEKVSETPQKPQREVESPAVVMPQNLEKKVTEVPTSKEKKVEVDERDYSDLITKYTLELKKFSEYSRAKSFALTLAQRYPRVVPIITQEPREGGSAYVVSLGAFENLKKLNRYLLEHEEVIRENTYAVMRF